MKYALRPSDVRKVRFYSSNLHRLPAKLSDKQVLVQQDGKEQVSPFEHPSNLCRKLVPRFAVLCNV